MPTDDTTVSDLQSHIRDLEQEVVDTKRVVNRLLTRKGIPPMYADAALTTEAGNVFAIRSDQFYGIPAASSAMREYLKMRKAANLGPASLNEIYDALVRGSFRFETENEDNRKRNLRSNLTKSSSLFHRLPNGHFGLPDWYEEIKKRTEDDGKAKKSKHAKKKGKTNKASKATRQPAEEEVLPKPTEAATPPVPGETMNGKTTVTKAVREAILAQKGEFTKQDVVNWIEKHHPTLKAQQRKTSIYSMMANLKGDLKLETVKAGKGTEPHRFRRMEEAAVN
jgi:hypothetical protein